MTSGAGSARRLAHVALLVRDYDEAIDWFTRRVAAATRGGRRAVRDLYGNRWDLIQYKT